MEQNNRAPDQEKSVIVMIGNYPRETLLSEVPKVIELAKNVSEYFLSKGVPKEAVDRLYTIKVIDNE